MSYIPPHLRVSQVNKPAISEAMMPYIPPHLRLSDQAKPAPTTPISPPSSSTQHPYLSFRSSPDVIYRFIVLLHHEHMSCQHVKFTTFEGETFSHLQHLRLYTLTADQLDPGQQNSTEVIEQIPRNMPVNVIVQALKEDLKEVLEKFRRFACAESRDRMVPKILLRFGKLLFHASRGCFNWGSSYTPENQQSCRGGFDWGSSYTPENLEVNVKTRRLSKTFDPCLSIEEFVFLRKLARKDALHNQWEEKTTIQVEDEMKPDSDLLCTCSHSEHNEQSVNPGMTDDLSEITGSAKHVLELKEVMLLPVRHMIGDVACVGKSADIRLAFLTQEYPELTEMELCDLKSSLNKESRHSSSGRFKVFGRSHSICKVVIGGGLKWYIYASQSSFQVYVEPIICEEFCEGQKEWNTEKAILAIEELLQRVWADCII